MKKLFHNLFVKFSREFKSEKVKPLLFTNVYTEISSIFLLTNGAYPEVADTLKVAKKIATDGKKVTVLIPEGLNFPEIDGKQIIKLTYSEKEISKLGLPKKSLKNKIKNVNCGAVIDFNFDDYSPLSLLTVYAQTAYRIGMKKINDDKYYNLIIAPLPGGGDFKSRILEVIKTI